MYLHMLLMTNMFLDHWFMFGSKLKIVNYFNSSSDYKIRLLQFGDKNEVFNMQDTVYISIKDRFL